MNVYDSERIAGVLAPFNYRKVEDIKNADLIIVNTCAIREKAEQKVYSFLGRLNQMKMKRPELVIGVGGCVAQQQGDKIFDRAPYVDMVFGTHAVTRLPGLMAKIENGQRRVVDIDSLIEPESMERIQNIKADESISRVVTIMQGCDNFCTYCVLMFVDAKKVVGRKVSSRK